MSSSNLSQQALEVHNQTLKKGKMKSNNPENRMGRGTYRQRPKNVQVQQMIEDSRSVRSVHTKKSDSGSGHSAAPSVTSVMRMRKRMTKWKNSKVSELSLNCRDHQIKLENTYSMEPDPGAIFNSDRTKAVILDTLRSHLDPLEGYIRERTTPLVKAIADDIRGRVKALGFTRHKIVAHVVIGEDRGQGFQIASQGVWDTDTDRMVPVTYQKKNLFATAVVFGTYFE